MGCYFVVGLFCLCMLLLFAIGILFAFGFLLKFKQLPFAAVVIVVVVSIIRQQTSNSWIYFPCKFNESNFQLKCSLSSSIDGVEKKMEYAFRFDDSTNKHSDFN